MVDEIEMLEMAEKIEDEIVESYVSSADSMTTVEWLSKELKKHFPEMPQEKIDNETDEIVKELGLFEKKKEELSVARSEGRSKESWLAKEILDCGKVVQGLNTAEYLTSVDMAISQANDNMVKALTTKASDYTVISQNPNLKGFISEAQFANRYNVREAVRGSDARMYDPHNIDKPYGKNSVDVMEKYEGGFHRYQLKCGKTAEHTIADLKKGNYRSQIFVVPKNQGEAVQKAFPNKTIVEMEYTADEYEAMQKEAQQNGDFLSMDWESIGAKDLAVGISNQVVNAGLLGVAFGGVFSIGEQLLSGEGVDGKKVVKDSIKTGADMGLKTAVTCGIKVAAEKGYIPGMKEAANVVGGNCLYTAAAFSIVEDVKIATKVASGEMTASEGADAVTETTCSTFAGVIASEACGKLGKKAIEHVCTWIGCTCGPAGAFVGKMVGKVVGYAVGSKIGKAIGKGLNKIRHSVSSGFSRVKESVSNAFTSIRMGIAGLFA